MSLRTIDMNFRWASKAQIKGSKYPSKVRLGSRRCTNLKSETSFLIDFIKKKKKISLRRTKNSLRIACRIESFDVESGEIYTEFQLVQINIPVMFSEISSLGERFRSQSVKRRSPTVHLDHYFSLRQNHSEHRTQHRFDFEHDDWFFH